MKKIDKKSEKLTSLRKKAETKLTKLNYQSNQFEFKELSEYIEELNIHQIELEMQNEELIRAQVELEQSRSNYIELYDFAPVGYFTFDKNGLILNVNLTGASLLGMERSFLIKKPFVQFVEPNHRDIFFIHCRKVLKSKSNEVCEIELLSKDKDKFYAKLECILLKSDNDESYQIRAIVSDVTEQKKAEDKIKKMNTELEKKVEKRTMELQNKIKELETFSYSIAHDLKSPLRAIHGFSDVLYNKISNDLDEESKMLFNVIIRNTLTMSKLIDDLLSFSRLCRQETNLSKVNIKLLLDEIIDKIKIEIIDRNIKFVIKSMPQVYADKEMMRVVLINLIYNAVKFTKNNKKAILEFSGEVVGTEAKFYLKDNGAGFDMKYYEKLFGVFQRLHKQDEYEGTGIGLALVQQIIQRHNGRIWAESKIDKGAVFYFTLPFEQTTKTN